MITMTLITRNLRGEPAHRRKLHRLHILKLMNHLIDLLHRSHLSSERCSLLPSRDRGEVFHASISNSTH